MERFGSLMFDVVLNTSHFITRKAAVFKCSKSFLGAKFIKVAEMAMW